jgi:phospholipid transport system transporter-binding protein
MPARKCPEDVPLSAEIAVVESAPDRYAVRGALTFATARRAVGAGLQAFSAARGGPIELDLGGVGAADSAGLAVLIEWLAWARRSGRQIHLANLPQALTAIARISETEELLGAR